MFIFVNLCYLDNSENSKEDSEEVEVSGSTVPMTEQHKGLVGGLVKVLGRKRREDSEGKKNCFGYFFMGLEWREFLSYTPGVNNIYRVIMHLKKIV